MYFILKTTISGILVATISEVAKRSSLLGALIASLPITSLLAMIWLYQENKNPLAVAKLSLDILWLVIPSLLLFVLLPIFLKKGMGFYLALSLSCLATALAYGITLGLRKAL